MVVAGLVCHFFLEFVKFKFFFFFLNLNSRFFILNFVFIQNDLILMLIKIYYCLLKVFLTYIYIYIFFPNDMKLSDQFGKYIKLKKIYYKKCNS